MVISRCLHFQPRTAVENGGPSLDRIGCRLLRYPPILRILVLTILALIDMVLVAGLVVMVMISGYENFVSRIETGEDSEELGWLSKLDAGTLKIKVAASIVAISSIHLLRVFMNTSQIPNDKLMWYVIIHLTFVISAVLMGILDKLSFSVHRDH